MKVRAVLVDDEELALKRLSRMLSEEPEIDIIGTAGSGREAIEIIERLKPDLVFLDIQMPGLNGFDVIRRLQRPPVVIFTTAYYEFALEAFATNAIDYLLKPVEKERLHRAIEKLKSLRAADAGELSEQLRALIASLDKQAREAPLTHVPAKLGDRIMIFPAADVAYFYASDKCTLLVTGDKEYVLEKTLSELETRLDPAKFVRIHRGTIVNLNNVREIVSEFGGHYFCRLKHPPRDLPVSRSMVKNLRSRFGF
jgi:two-component system, LytTR family, response regulator